MTDAAPPEIPESPAPIAPAPSVDSEGFSVSKWYVFALVVLPTTLILLTMSGVLGPILRDGQSLWRLPYLLVANTPTGGDMGAHVLLPKVLLEDVLSAGRVLGWSMDWYAGFPVLYFYFPLPALTTVVLDLILPYGIAFKLVTILGLVALPACSYFFVRYIGFTRFLAVVAGIGGSLFVFMESYSIFGANVKSTLAGEFSFSWSFALSILYIGLVVRSYRRGRKIDVWAGVVLGLTVLAHIITTIVAVVAVLPLVLAPIVLLLVDRDRARHAGSGAIGVISTWVIGFGLSAFWSLALGINVLTGMTSDMGWAPVTTITGNYQNPGSPIPGELVPALVIAVLGMVWAALRSSPRVASVWITLVALGAYFGFQSAYPQNDKIQIVLLAVAALAAMWTAIQLGGTGVAIWLTIFPLIGYFVIALSDFTVLYNARLLPYWFFGVYMFAGLAIGMFAVAVGRQFENRQQATLVAGAVAAVLMVGSAGLAMHDLPGWVKWTYEGYEGKQDWAEYEGLMQTVDELPPGRIMWEANSEMNKYGTPMSLMLFPYWSEGHPSMEGLFFESSLTTPFHFLNAAEVSRRPSNPVRGLNYHGMNFDRGTKHLAVYDVEYYVSYTEEARLAADQFGLEQIAESAPWTIFALPEADRIDVASMEPVVWAGDESFVDAALDWYDDVENLDAWLVEDGPSNWRRVSSVDERLEGQRPYETTGEVEITVFEDHEVSFTTSAVGVPHLVKVSYFPNWRVEGADQVYRVAPSLMMVVPTQAEVTLQFKNRWVENLGTALSGITLLGLATYGLVVLRRKKKARA